MLRRIVAGLSNVSAEKTSVGEDDLRGDDLIASKGAEGDDIESGSIDDKVRRAASTARAGDNRRRLAINAAAGGGANMAKIGIQVVMIPLMARLLGPAEFGLFALAMPTISLLMALADGGLGASMARENEASAEIWSTAFWILLGIGITLGLLVIGWGMILATITHEPRLRGIMVLLSLSFLFAVVTVLPAARLIRQGRLFVISGGDLLSTIVGSLVAIALAISGAGAWSLAVQYLVVVAGRAVVCNIMAFVRPTAAFKLSNLTGHLVTGSSLLGARLSDFGGRLVEYLAYERIFGTSSLANYTFANQTPRFICEAVSGPVWTALYAHALHEEPNAIRSAHLKVIYILSLVVFPVAFLLAGTAREVIDLVLGKQWEHASDLLRILVPCYALSLIAGQSGALMLAYNRGWLLFWIILGGTLARIVAVALGPWIGQMGVGFGIAGTLVGTSAAFLLAPLVSKRGERLVLFRAGAIPFLCAGIGGVASYLTISHLPGGILPIAAALATGSFCYVILILMVTGRQLISDIKAIQGYIFGTRISG